MIDDKVEVPEWMKQYFKQLGNWAFAEMSKQVSINDIMNWIINVWLLISIPKDASLRVLPFGNVKTMLTLMSENNNYEAALNLSLGKIMEEECSSCIKKQEHIIAQGTAMTTTLCYLCSLPLYSGHLNSQLNNQIVVFWYKQLMSSKV
ncbi:hypothetical protein MXB_1648 [Myxobolus squamalis]|nr:hypothetical protein MXB_1648 [Myxobolus squamalis]